MPKSVLPLLALLILFSGCPAGAAPAESRYVIDGRDWPAVAAVYAQATSDVVGLVRFDARGVALIDLTCGAEDFIGFAAEIVPLLKSRPPEAEDREPPPARGKRPAPDERKRGAVTKAAANSADSMPIMLQNMGTTQIAELRSLVEERGGAAGLRQFAAQSLHRMAEEHPETSKVLTLAGNGSYLGMWHPDGRLIHPEAEAARIRHNPEFKGKTSAVIIAPGVGRSDHPRRLAKALGMPVRANRGLVVVHGMFSIVDSYLFPEQMRAAMAVATRQGDAEAAALLARYRDVQRMVAADAIEAEEHRTESLYWTRKAAELGDPVCRYNAAYLALQGPKPDTKEAARWIDALAADPAPKDERFAGDLNALRADLLKAKGIPVR